jgi:hypothetical protein
VSVIQKESNPALAANATVDNVFSGSAFEFARQNSLLNMAVVGSATGLVATIQVGSRVVLEESPISLLGTMPKLQDDFYYSEGVLQGERIICRIRNTTAGALTYRVVAQLQPV